MEMFMVCKAPLLLIQGDRNLFSFDRVFTRESLQNEVYEYAAADIVQGILGWD
jgi:hypothetical protein